MGGRGKGEEGMKGERRGGSKDVCIIRKQFGTAVLDL